MRNSVLLVRTEDVNGLYRLLIGGKPFLGAVPGQAVLRVEVP